MISQPGCYNDKRHSKQVQIVTKVHLKIAKTLADQLIQSGTIFSQSLRSGNKCQTLLSSAFR